MDYLIEKCTLREYNNDILEKCNAFNCGNNDLNQFFSRDVLLYNSQLLGKSYCFTSDNNSSDVVCAFTLSNDSIKTYTLPNSRKKKINLEIPRPKHLRSYPAVLIGRLGVNINYKIKNSKNESIGDQLLIFIKAWFIEKNNKTGCRYLVVDSYNDEKPLNFYKRNGFNSLFSSEEQEKLNLGLNQENKLNTRLLYFDLILLS